MDTFSFVFVRNLLFKIYKMKIEFEGDIYETDITKPILEGDFYYDCMTHEVKKCKSYICFDPWSLKLQKIKENENIND